MVGLRNGDIDMAQDINNDDDSSARTGEADIRSVVENANAEDDRLKNNGDASGDDDDDSEDDDAGDDADSKDSKKGEADDTDDGDSEDDDDSKDDGDKSKSTRKFSQYSGDGSDEAYISGLEKAYQNSSAEAVRINQELQATTGRVDAIMRAAAADPELATKLNEAIKSAGAGGDSGDGSGGDQNVAENPFVTDLQAQWSERSQEEIAKFIEANPEVVSDPKIEKDVKYWMGVFSREHKARTGRLLSGGDAMAQAYKHLDLENKLEKQSLAAGAKKSAAPSRQRSGAKKATSQKPAFTDEQVAFAKSMGHDQAWLEKNAQ